MFSREIPLIGAEGYEKLKKAHVAVFGVGGVGGFICEMLARAGVEEITVVDFDKVSLSNINRQIIALQSTLGRLKVEVIKERLEGINPNIKVHMLPLFVNQDTIKEIDFHFSYICDAVDNVTAKILLIEEAKKRNIPIISSMGTGNKLNPTLFKIKDINQTKVCPLARVMRLELRKRNITNVPVLYSEEEPQKANFYEGNKAVPASVCFTPSVAGILIARHVILDLIK